MEEDHLKKNDHDPPCVQVSHLRDVQSIRMVSGYSLWQFVSGAQQTAKVVYRKFFNQIGILPLVSGNSVS